MRSMDIWHLLQQSEEERNAYSLLILMISVMNMLSHKVHEPLHITDKDLEKHFPSFAQSVGARGKLYEMTDGKCPTVEMYKKSCQVESFLIFLPTGAWEMEPEEQHSEYVKRVVPAVIEILRELRPNWKWQS